MNLSLRYKTKSRQQKRGAAQMLLPSQQVGGVTMQKPQVIPDKTYADMWRVCWPDGKLSDMVNLSRANDAARRRE
jgi:hypothetical protein